MHRKALFRRLYTSLQPMQCDLGHAPRGCSRKIRKTGNFSPAVRSYLAATRDAKVPKPTRAPIRVCRSVGNAFSGAGSASARELRKQKSPSIRGENTTCGKTDVLDRKCKIF